MVLSDNQTKILTAAGLNLIAQALSIYDQDLTLAVSNAPFQQMFDLPDHLVSPGARFDDTIRHLAGKGEYGDVADIELFVKERVNQARAFQPHYMERTRANGRTISVEGSPLPQGGWVTVYTDITRIKQNEALLNARSDALSGQVITHAEQLAATNRELASMITTLEETKRQLTHSEARTRLTTEMMPAHIAHVNRRGIYTYSNRRLSSIIPGRPSNIIGLHLKDALGQSTYDSIKNSVSKACRGKPAVIEFTETQGTRRIRAAFTPDEEGGAYIMSMDVTEETQARVALQQTHKRESAARLISGLAHDFSNLLTIILGMQSQLARLGDLPQDAPDLINGTMAAAHRGGRLLQSIADMTGSRTHRPAATDLGQLIRDLVTLATPSLPNGVSLIIDDKCPDLVALIDKGLVQDSLLNLILNARDACGASGQITLTQRYVPNTWVEWVIDDTGPGFSNAALTHGTDPFFTTKGSEGSGLGLTMVYDTAKSAGGDLRLQISDDGGARAVFRLPYRAALPSDNGLALLVEDADDLRELVRDMLMQNGYSVIEATSADEATALIADLSDISLILSDIQLTGEATGLDLARRVNNNMPLVLMTSLPTDNPLFKQAQNIGPVLQKPFTSEDLAALIQPENVAPA